MKTLWKSIGYSALVLALVHPWRVLAQQEPAPAPAVANTTAQPIPPAAATPGSTAPVATNSTPSASSMPVPLSPWAAEIAKLAKAGIHDDVILTYIDSTEGTFNLSADQIIHLKSVGVSSQALAAMMRHDNEVNLGIRTITASTIPSSQPALHIVFAPPDADRQREPKFAEASTAPSTDSRAGENFEEPQAAETSLVQPVDWTPDFNDSYENAEMVQPSPGGWPDSYPVRQPYVEEVMGPILVFKASGRTPNVFVIDYSP